MLNYIHGNSRSLMQSTKILSWMLQFSQSPVKWGKETIRVWVESHVCQTPSLDNLLWTNGAAFKHHSWMWLLALPRSPRSSPNDHVREAPLRHRMEPVQLPQLPAPWNPIYSSELQANLTTVMTFPSTASSNTCTALLTHFCTSAAFHPTRLIPSLGNYKPQEGRACITVNNSHFLNAYYVPATVGDTW